MSKNNKGSVMNMIEHERHRVAASITHEQDWEHPEPNSGLARMFVIMLAVHVLVIGGIIIYDFVGGDSSTPKTAQASSSATPSKSTPGATAARVESKPLPTIASTATNGPVSAPASVSPPPPTVPEAPKTPTLSVVDTKATAIPKAIPFTDDLPLPSGAADKESVKPAVTLAKANTFDPIAFKEDAEPAPIHTKVTEPTPEKIKISTDKPKSGSDGAKPSSSSDKPRKVEDKPASYKPVATPSAARKALSGDNKPPAATPARKKDKAESDPPKKTTKPSPRSGKSYTVAKGDTIYSLARKYKVSEEALMKANGIKKATSLSIGKTLSIPASKQ